MATTLSSLRSMMAGLAVLAAAAPAMALACTYTVVMRVEADNRAACRAVLDAQNRTYGDIRRGKRDLAKVRSIADSLYRGSDGCPSRADIAFRMLDAAMGSPIPSDVDPASLYKLHRYLGRAERVPEERRREIELRHWMTNGTYVPGICADGTFRHKLPEGWNESETRTELLRPDNWKAALANFGRNPMRDRMQFAEMLDSGSSYFNPAMAADIAEKIRDRSAQIDAAMLLANPGRDGQQLERAAELTRWYSPYATAGLAEEELASLAQIWRRIGHARAASTDPAIAASGAYLLETGDPHASPGKDPASIAGEGVAYRVLEGWPEIVSTPRNMARFRARVQANYPSRPLRQMRGGRVELAAIFNPDGAFARFEILRSAGEQLDKAAMRSYERYYRPRFSELALEPTPDTMTIVPLWPIEFHIIAKSADPPRSDGETITVIAYPLRSSM